ncbi:MAG: hypothetical protein RIR47_1058 [Bacteroidota bacterium]
MSYYKFKSHDILINNIKTFPSYNFYVYNGNVYLDNAPPISGAFTNNVGMVPSGYINLYDLNIDRNRTRTGLIYPFITKDGAREGFSSVGTSTFNNLAFGDVITGSYPLSSSISRDFYTSGQTRNRIDALRNTINYYKLWSPRFNYSSSYCDFSDDKINLISIPSIFYGEQIKKGSLVLKYFITGTLAAQAEDIKKNGELIQTLPVGSVGSGSVVGLVLYNEGFVILTNTSSLNSDSNNYGSGITGENPSWVYFGTYISGNMDYSGVSFMNVESYSLYFEGVHTIPNMTLFMNAPKNELNNSSNPTFLAYSTGSSYYTSSMDYKEIENREIKNTVFSEYADPTGSFEKHTYITKINIYDENKNIIGIAKLAKPVKKTEGRDLTFKIKLDL